MKENKTTIKVEFNKGKLLVGIERAEDYHTDYSHTAGESSKKFVSLERVEDWYIYILPWFPIHVQTTHKTKGD
jgi:hypothetical protein